VAEANDTPPLATAAPDDGASEDATSTQLSSAQTTDQLTQDDSRSRKHKDRSARKGPSKGLLWTGVGVGVASAGLWGVTVMDGLSYEAHLEDALDGDYRTQDDVDQAQGEIDSHYQRVNALGYAAQATSATAGVLLVAAFVF
jgi:hypothetical protein